jgi:hypothetical protein
MLSALLIERVFTVQRPIPEGKRLFDLPLDTERMFGLSDCGEHTFV